MSYMGALLVADKFKLVNMPLPTMEAAMVNAFNTFPSPEAVTVVAKDQRASTAPKQDDLLRLVKARLAPVKIDGEWFKGNVGLIHKAFSNVLENADAEVIHWDKARYDIWAAKGEARWRERRKTQEQEQSSSERQDRTKRQSKHGYVYAFHYRNPTGASWIKVGMTSSDDEAACWGRIKDYIKTHNLPGKGWEFVGFVACVEAYALEKRLHGRMHKFRFVQGSARELFRCSLSVYLGMLDAEDEFIKEHAPDTADEEIERAKQAEAKRQAQRDREQQAKEKAHREREAREVEARKREQAEREAREKAHREREAREVEARKREQAEREAREKWERHVAERQAERDRQRKQVEREAREKAETARRAENIVPFDRQQTKERRQAEEHRHAAAAEMLRRAEAEEQRLVKAVAGWKRQQTPLDRDTRGYVRRSVSGGSGSGRTEPYLETLMAATVPLLVSAVLFAFAFFVHSHG